MKPVQKHTTLLGLYIAQSIPMSFFATVLPVIMRMENYSLESIGLIQLIKIPWILKFFWAPWVDRNAGKRHGYKKWIIGSEMFYAVVILSIGLFNLSTDFRTIVILMVAAFFLSATQDIASDALAIKILHKNQRSMGNSMQSSGSFLGTLFGSGVLLMLYPVIGWHGIIFMLSGIVLVALFPLMINVKNHQTMAPEDSEPATWRDVITFFRSTIVIRRILFLMIYYSGILGILVMLKPFLVDLGYDIKTIGFIAGIYGTAFGTAFAFLAGWIIKRIGNRNAVFLMASYSFLTALFFSTVIVNVASPLAIYAGVALLWSAYSMSTVVVYTVSMNLVRPGREGTDYSIQIVVTHLSGLSMAVLSGFVAERIDYRGLFGAEAVWAFIVIILSSLLYQEKDEKELLEAGNLMKKTRLWKFTQK